MMETREKSKRGFAAMTPERQRSVASMGGKAAHALGRAHQWTSAEATAAGKKGGKAMGVKPRKKTDGKN